MSIPAEMPAEVTTLPWFDSRIANGLIEGINSLVQAAKAKARGYRNRDTLKAMTYLIAGKLDLRLLETAGSLYSTIETIAERQCR